MRVSTYDPAQVTVILGGFTITGFAKGRMVEYQNDGAIVDDAFGVDGEPARWVRSNPFGILTLSLALSSPSNFVLSGLLNVDRLTMAGILPLLIQDRSSGGVPTRILAGSAWIKELPPITWGENPETRRWTVRVLNAIYDIHGYDENAVVSA